MRNGPDAPYGPPFPARYLLMWLQNRMDDVSEDELDQRRDALRTRIDQHEAEEAQKAVAATRSSAAGYAVAFRLSSELVAAIIVGGLIGFGLDWLLGTLPWLFILFILLGFVAGVLNVLRSAGLIQPPQVGKRPREGTDR